MQGTWNHDRAHYRCRYPSEYALANDLDHPPAVYLREDQLTEPLDTWLTEAFHPDHIEDILNNLEHAQPDNTPALDTARHTLAGLDRKLATYRAALEAGTDPTLVAEWTKEIQTEREYITAQIAASEAQRRAHTKMTRTEIEQLIRSLDGITAILRKADPADKLEVYRQLGLKLTFDHTTRTVAAEAIPRPPVGVLVVSGGGYSGYPQRSTCGNADNSGDLVYQIARSPHWLPARTGDPRRRVVYGEE
jgi:hypothetical protein